jgi:serine/alanine adding enzyme
LSLAVSGIHLELNPSIRVDAVQESERLEYQAYVRLHPAANYCHDIAWRDIIQKTYQKKPLYFLCRTSDDGSIRGVLPAFHLSSPMFGKEIVSLPYLDNGGILAHDPEAENALLSSLLETARHIRAKAELRNVQRLASYQSPANEKVGMSVDLAGLDESQYWNKLNPKVRNQVRKAEKSQVSIQTGRHELLKDFYQVFARNMRDLGSPVHSVRFFANLLTEIPAAQICSAYRDNRCVGGLVRLPWRDTLAIPWASTLREERVHCPNNALYWQSIRYAFENQLRWIDLGRSTRGEGTYKFKLQWLAKESPLPWFQFDTKGNMAGAVRHASSGPLAVFTRVWMKLPVPVSKLLGPYLRSLISA